MKKECKGCRKLRNHPVVERGRADIIGRWMPEQIEHFGTGCF